MPYIVDCAIFFPWFFRRTTQTYVSFGPSWGIVEVWAAARPCNGLYEFDTKPGERAATNTKLLSISAA